jgi:hypothetical protein
VRTHCAEHDRTRATEPEEPVGALHTAALAVLFGVPVVILVEGLLAGDGRLALVSVPVAVLAVASVRALVLNGRARRVAAAAGPRAALPVRVLAALWAVLAALSVLLGVGVLNLPA